MIFRQLDVRGYLTKYVDDPQKEGGKNEKSHWIWRIVEKPRSAKKELTKIN